MVKKIYFFIQIFFAVIVFKFSFAKKNFRNWLYLKVVDEKSCFFRSENYILFLIIDSKRHGSMNEFFGYVKEFKPLAEHHKNLEKLIEKLGDGK